MMRQLRDFRTDRSGGAAVLFALSLLPFAAMAGAALDYSRASATLAAVQQAADSTALMLAHKAARMSAGELQALGQPYFQTMVGHHGSTIGAIRVAKTDRTVELAVEGRVPSTLMKLVNRDYMEIGTRATAAYGIQRIELALVLDNTGSMAWSNKLTELKSAAGTLLDTLENVAIEPGAVKVSVVPFATQVNVGTGNRDAAWLDHNNPSLPNRLKVAKKDWKGCVSDRDQPNDTNDKYPLGGQVTLYPAAACQYGVLQPVQPLTDNFTGLRNVINQMRAEGNTNVSIGVVHGLATLSPGQPYTGASSFGEKNVSKFMVILTDGENTENRFSANSSQINQRTELACQSAKDPALAVTVYTIRVIEGNRSLLRKCASDESKYFEVSAAAQLGPVFKKIADEITSIRLTQ